MRAGRTGTSKSPGSGGPPGRPTRLAIGLLGVMGLALTAVGTYSAYLFETEPPIVLGYRDPVPAATAPVLPPLVGAPLPAIAAPATPAAAKAPASVGKPVLRRGVWLEIPVLGIALPVERGQTAQPVPHWKALVYPGTAWPGQPGNSYVYAHGIWGEFGGLVYAKIGQPVYVHDYDTSQTEVLHVSRVVGQVPWNDASWLEETSSAPLLTLQTCLESVPKSPLWIVQAG